MDAIYKFQYTEKHLLTSMMRYREQIWWRRPFTKYRWQIAGIALVTLFLGVQFSQLLAVISAVVFGAILVGWPIDSFVLRRRFKKSPYYNDQLIITISDQGLEAIGKSSSVRMEWNIFTKARRFNDGMLLFQGPHVFNWLPNVAAVEPTTVQAANELIKANVTEYRNV